MLVTSLEQSPNAIALVHSKLQGNPEFFATASCLEDLFLYRVKSEWRDISGGSFSSFLAIVQGIQALGMMLLIFGCGGSTNTCSFAGSGPAIRCERALQDKIRYKMSGVEISRDPFATPQTGLNAAEKIRLAVERREVSTFVREYLPSIIEDPLILYSTTEFESTPGISLQLVINLFLGHIMQFFLFWNMQSHMQYVYRYKLLVYQANNIHQLCVANPDHGIVLPWSWAMLHLPRVLHPDLRYPKFSSTEIRIHMNLLTTINNYFCMFLNQVNAALDEGILNFHGDRHAFPWNQKREMSIIFKRRSTELLMTVIVNLNHWAHPPTDYIGMKNLARRVLTPL